MQKYSYFSIFQELPPPPKILEKRVFFALQYPCVVLWYIYCLTYWKRGYVPTYDKHTHALG